MSENLNPATTELDLDDWLAGGQRNTQLVNLYARGDLYADIDALERQKVDVPKTDELDASLGGEADPNADLQLQIDSLWQQLGASKKEFRVAGRTTEETQAIEAAIRKELSAEIDAAAALGRAEGKKSADRMGIKAVEDVNRIVRAGALEHIGKLVEFEVAVRTIAASTTVKVRETWKPITAEQVRALYAKLGEAQVELLAQAASRSANEAPVVTVPKS